MGCKYGYISSCVENGGQLNGGRAKAALNFWTQLLPFAPPEALQSTWSEVDHLLLQEELQGWAYGENAAWIATDAEKSAVAGNVGVNVTSYCTRCYDTSCSW